MKNTKQKLKRITTHITSSQYDWLQAYAEHKAINYQALIRMILAEYIHQKTQEAQHHDQTTFPDASWPQRALSRYASGSE